MLSTLSTCYPLYPLCYEMRYWKTYSEFFSIYYKIQTMKYVQVMTVYTSDNTVHIYDRLARVELNYCFQFYTESRKTTRQRVKLLVLGLQPSRTTTPQSIEFMIPRLQSINKTAQH